MNKDCVSIIVPIYKVPEDYLKKSIESLLNQTYKNIEIILVDDGSPDKCGEICDYYGKLDRRVKVIHQENKGLCGARNSGVYESNGEWITFVDGDDWLEEEAIESLMKKIDSTYDVLIFGTIKDYKNKTFKYNYGKIIKFNKDYLNEECKVFLKAVLNFESSIGDATARLIRRKYLIENDIWHDEKIRQGVEAIDFNIKLFEKAKKVKIVDDYFYHYVFNTDSITNYFTEEKCYITLNGYKAIYKYLIDNNLEEFLKMFYERLIHNIVSTAISGFFNPKYKIKYRIKVKKFDKYVSDDLLKNAINNVDFKNIEKKQRIILKLINYRMYYFVSILAKIRFKQKNK